MQNIINGFKNSRKLFFFTLYKVIAIYIIFVKQIKKYSPKNDKIIKTYYDITIISVYLNNDGIRQRALFDLI